MEDTFPLTHIAFETCNYFILLSFTKHVHDLYYILKLIYTLVQPLFSFLSFAACFQLRWGKKKELKKGDIVIQLSWEMLVTTNTKNKIHTGKSQKIFVDSTSFTEM
jgi:hypothetical protein